MQDKNYVQNLLDDYKNLEGIEAIAIGGSSSTNYADSASDVDIYIYSKCPPDTILRKQIALKYALEPEIDNHYFECGDTFVIEKTAKPIDVMYRTPDFIEENINRVWINGCACMGFSTCFIYNVHNSKVVFDPKGWYGALKELTNKPYPKKLAKNIIEKNFKYLKKANFSYYDQIKSAIKRNDKVSINHRTSAFLASYFDVLFAKNELLHPGEKKLVQFALNNCKILPKDFEFDVNSFAAGEISNKLELADLLIENLAKLL